MLSYQVCFKFQWFLSKKSSTYLSFWHLQISKVKILTQLLEFSDFIKLVIKCQFAKCLNLKINLKWKPHIKIKIECLIDQALTYCHQIILSKIQPFLQVKAQLLEIWKQVRIRKYRLNCFLNLDFKTINERFKVLKYQSIRDQIEIIGILKEKYTLVTLKRQVKIRHFIIS